MCGRFNNGPLTTSQIGKAIGIEVNPDQIPIQYNIAPTENVSVFANTNDGIGLFSMRWWLVPGWSKGPSSKYAMFNARSEGIEKSRAYGAPFKLQRCIIPASSFIEWQATPEGKQPILIEPENGPLAFAAVWDYWEGPHKQNSIYSCSILTTEAPEGFDIHSRIPVMLHEDEYEIWLHKSYDLAELQEIMKSRLPFPLKTNQIEKHINSSQYKLKPELSTP